MSDCYTIVTLLCHIDNVVAIVRCLSLLVLLLLAVVVLLVCHVVGVIAGPLYC